MDDGSVGRGGLRTPPATASAVLLRAPIRHAGLLRAARMMTYLRVEKGRKREGKGRRSRARPLPFRLMRDPARLAGPASRAAPTDKGGALLSHARLKPAKADGRKSVESLASTGRGLEMPASRSGGSGRGAGCPGSGRRLAL